MKEVTVTHYRDNNNQPCVWLPVTNSYSPVHMYEEDFDTIYKLGVIPVFKLMDNQIWERGRSRLSVARIIADAKAGERVVLVDNNPHNLKFDNLLRVKGGSGKYDARERLSKLERRRLVALNHRYITPSWKEEEQPTPSWIEK